MAAITGGAPLPSAFFLQAGDKATIMNKSGKKNKLRYDFFFITIYLKCFN
jgi:hypothetical protein